MMDVLNSQFIRRVSPAELAQFSLLITLIRVSHDPLYLVRLRREFGGEADLRAAAPAGNA